MSPRTSDYALLSQNVYEDTEVDKYVDLDGIKYRVMAAENDPITGFQAQAYVREDVTPQQVIVAFRGTEFDRQPVRDGGVDAAMVLTGVNLQKGDAMAFTQKVMNDANENARDEDRPAPDITVTGHSLGGTLAELAASRYGLHGETFNAYGAAGLREGVPEGGNQVIDHVRAGDLVSAASEHFGEVRIYAAQQDIDNLSHAGYRDDSTILSLRNPIKATDFSAHAIDNFVPNSKLLGQSIISDESQARYRSHEGMVDRYRDDVMDIRKGLSASWEIPKAVGELRETLGDGVVQAGHLVSEAGQEIKEGLQHVRDEVSKDLHAAGAAISHGASSAWNTVTHPGSWFHEQKPDAPRLDQPSHPDHLMFRQALTGVHQIDEQHGRMPDTQSGNIAGALTTAARKEGMTQIDHVLMNADASRTYAVQGDINSPLKRVAEVSTAQAVATSVETSSQQWHHAAAQQQTLVEQAQPSRTQPSAPPI